MSPGLKSASVSSSLALIMQDLDFPRRTQLCHELSTRLTPWRFSSHTGASAVFGAGLPPSLNLRDRVSQGSSLPPLEAEPSREAWHGDWLSVFHSQGCAAAKKQGCPDAVGAQCQPQPPSSCGLRLASRGPRTRVSATRSIWLYLGTKYRKVVIVQD